MKKIVTVLFMTVVSFLIVKHETWMNYIYSSLGNKQVSIKGISKNFEVACRDLPISTSFCAKGYRYPFSSWNEYKSELVSVGAGTFFGGTIWYCETGKGVEKIFETGNPDGSSKFRSNYNFYQYAVVSPKLCSGDVFVEAVGDPYFSPNFVGWRLGPILIGKPSVVSAYKNVYDFFSSYLRAILGILALVFLFSAPKKAQRSFAHKAYFGGIVSLSLMMLFTSGLIDILIPSLSPYVMTLVSVTRCVGYTYLLVSILSRTNRLALSISSRLLSIYGALLLSLGSIVLFKIFSGKFDLSVVLFYGVGIFISALVSRSLTLIIFGLLLICDGLAIATVLPSYPTFSSVPFLFIAFLYDSTRSIFLRSKVEELFQRSDRNPDLFYEALNFISKHLSVKRVSITITGESASLKSFLISKSGPVLISEQASASRIFSQVAISKLPLLRIGLGSPDIVRICGSDASLNYKHGVEFCVYPMFYQGRFYGTLNITGYTLMSIGDISDLELLLELVMQCAFRIQDAVYRSKVSPNTVESRIALEVENELYSDSNVTVDKVKESLDEISKSLNGRLIVSTANREAGSFHLFSVHCASLESATKLIFNTPKINSFNAHSPVNIAFQEKRDLFIDTLFQFETLYPRYITDHVKRHGTGIVYVAPVLGVDGGVWGTVWAESGSIEKDRANGRLEEIVRILAHSARRQLEYFLKQQSHALIQSALDFLVPTHVAAKIKEGQSPREEEIGYLLNIDIVGSTPFSKRIGDRKFSVTMRVLSQELQSRLGARGFQLQMIIWDAFIFTRTIESGPFDLSSLEQIKEDIIESIEKIVLDYKVGYRAVLHYGDTTRDLISNSNHGWGIVGPALAESCKVESNNKHIRNDIIVTKEAREFGITLDVESPL